MQKSGNAYMKEMDMHCALCTVATASLLLRSAEIGQFCCCQTEFFAMSAVIDIVLDVQVPTQVKNDPKYVDAVEAAKETAVFHRYHAYRLVSTYPAVLGLLSMKYTGVRHLLSTCILHKIRSKFPSRSGKYAGTKHQRNSALTQAARAPVLAAAAVTL
eukprot:IDg21919t1